jgi:small subunit ribosomal protein S16
MVTIRLQRRGGKKEPFYHVVVTDSRRAGGGSLEQVGFYNPVARGNSQELRLDLGRVDYWLGVGAQASDRVAQLIKTYRKSQPVAAAA